MESGAMRVIVTARQTLTPVYQQVLQRLVNILGTISKNPSNPNFDQYIFESISALMRWVRGRRADSNTDARGQVRRTRHPSDLIDV